MHDGFVMSHIASFTVMRYEPFDNLHILNEDHIHQRLPARGRVGSSWIADARSPTAVVRQARQFLMGPQTQHGGSARYLHHINFKVEAVEKDITSLAVIFSQ